MTTALTVVDPTSIPMTSLPDARAAPDDVSGSPFRIMALVSLTPHGGESPAGAANGTAQSTHRMLDSTEQTCQFATINGLGGRWQVKRTGLGAFLSRVSITFSK
jgi:hypothetical protein